MASGPFSPGAAASHLRRVTHIRWRSVETRGGGDVAQCEAAGLGGRLYRSLHFFQGPKLFLSNGAEVQDGDGDRDRRGQVGVAPTRSTPSAGKSFLRCQTRVPVLLLDLKLETRFTLDLETACIVVPKCRG